MRQVVLHVVAKIVEAVFVVGAVGDVGTVRCAALCVVEIVDNDADRHAKATVERAHPLGVTAGPVSVYSDDVNGPAGERIYKRRKRGGERSALTPPHFRECSVAAHESAKHLHIVMS